MKKNVEKAIWKKRIWNIEYKGVTKTEGQKEEL